VFVRFPARDSTALVISVLPTNQVLSALPADVKATIESTGEELHLQSGQVLHSNIGVPVGSVYFPRTGVISVRSNYPSGEQVEVAAVGNDGAFGLFGLLGVPVSSMVAEVTLDTHVTKVPLTEIQRSYGGSAEMRRVVALFLAKLFSEVVRSVGCYRFHTHDQWVARWLLTTADKALSDTFSVTHDVIARRIGSQRHAVSTSLAHLRAAEAIRSERGIVSICDRACLEALSCTCYAPPDGSRAAGVLARAPGADPFA
jgi:CRP-like cAMP-binding protein